MNWTRITAIAHTKSIQVNRLVIMHNSLELTHYCIGSRTLFRGMKTER
jgi:hypothetical protein